MAALAWLGLMTPLLSAAAWSCEWHPAAAIDTAANRHGIIHLSVFICNLLEVSEMRARTRLSGQHARGAGCFRPVEVASHVQAPARGKGRHTPIPEPLPDLVPPAHRNPHLSARRVWIECA